MVDNYCKPLRLEVIILEATNGMIIYENEPLILFVDFKVVLQPRHVTVLTANFIRPPTVGVAIWIVLV